MNALIPCEALEAEARPTNHFSPITNHVSLLLDLWESHRIQQKLLVFFPMFFHPFFTSSFPSELATFLSLYPFILSNLFLNQVRNSIEGIRQHHRRHLHILF